MHQTLIFILICIAARGQVAHEFLSPAVTACGDQYYYFVADRTARTRFVLVLAPSLACLQSAPPEVKEYARDCNNDHELPSFFSAFKHQLSGAYAVQTLPMPGWLQ